MKRMGFPWICFLVADSHRSTAMGAGVLQFASLEEVHHDRLAVGAFHRLSIVIADGWVLGRGGVSNLDHYHLALIAHHGSILGR